VKQDRFRQLRRQTGAVGEQAFSIQACEPALSPLVKAR
jgi:hypothetical protein